MSVRKKSENQTPSPPPLPPPPGLVDSKVDCVQGGVEGGVLHQQQAVHRLVAALVADVLHLLVSSSCCNNSVNSLQLRRLAHRPAPLLLLLRVLLHLLLHPHPELAGRGAAGPTSRAAHPLLLRPPTHLLAAAAQTRRLGRNYLLCFKVKESGFAFNYLSCGDLDLEKAKILLIRTKALRFTFRTTLLISQMWKP